MDLFRIFALPNAVTLPFFVVLISSNLAFSQPSHDQEKTEIIPAPNGQIGLRETKDKLAFFKLPASASPILNWALASALSLDVPLVVTDEDGENRLTVGKHGNDKEFLIDARFIEKTFTKDRLRVLYFFVKGDRRIKLFGHTIHEFPHLDSVMERIANFEGLLRISVNNLLLAHWYQERDFDENAWEFVGGDNIRLDLIPFSDVVLLAPENRAAKINFKCLKRNTYDPIEALYRVIGTPVEVNGLEKQLIRLLEIERRLLGGSIACLTSLSAGRTCFHVGPRFSVSRLEYDDRIVKRLLRLSIGSLPSSFYEPLFFKNGNVVLTPVKGQTHYEVARATGEMLNNFLSHPNAIKKIALPIIYGSRWVALVLNISEDISLTYLDSSRNVDYELFNILLKVVEKAMDGRIIDTSCVKLFHLAPTPNDAASAPLIIESILRELEVSGPPMPFMLCDRDLQELRSSHLEMLRFFETQPAMMTPRDDAELDNLGSLPSVAHLIPSILSRFSK